MMAFIFLIFTNIIGFFPLLLYKKEKSSHEIYFLEPFLWLVAIASLYELIATITLKINPIYWFRLYPFLEFYVLLYIFNKLFLGRYNVFFKFFGLLYLVVFLSLLFVWNTMDFFITDSYLSIIESVFVFICTFLWFRDIFINLYIKSLFDSSVFYFISGILLYFSGTLFLLLLSEIILKNKELNLYNYWFFNVFFVFIFRIFLIIGVWKGRVK